MPPPVAGVIAVTGPWKAFGEAEGTGLGLGETSCAKHEAEVTTVAINKESKGSHAFLLEKREPGSKETSGPLWPIAFGALSSVLAVR